MFKNIINSILSLGIVFASTLGLFAFSSIVEVGVLANNDLPGREELCGDKCPIIGANNVEIENQSTLVTIIINIAQFLTFIAVGLAVLFMVWGGIRYITSNGNTDTAGTAKQILINATIGLIVSIVAATVVFVISGFVGGSAGSEILST